MENTNIQNTQGTDKAQNLVALEGLIINYLEKIENQQTETSKVKEMLSTALENDPDYSAACEQLKETTKVKKEVKARLLKQPDISSLYSQVKEATADLKEMRQTLSTHLQSYAQIAGTNQFEDKDGQVREIVYTAKVIKRGGKFNS